MFSILAVKPLGCHSQFAQIAVFLSKFAEEGLWMENLSVKQAQSAWRAQLTAASLDFS